MVPSWSRQVSTDQQDFEEIRGFPMTSLDTPYISSEISRDKHAFITADCTKCGHTVVIPVWCGDRLCPTCAKARAMKYSRYLHNKIDNILARKEWVRFITLTVRNESDLSCAFKKLTDGFRRLKDRNIWKNNVKGGVLSVEISFVRGWHVHIHALFEGGYIDQADLSRAWRDVTPDKSYIVDIRAIRCRKGAIREMAKYPFKPADVHNLTSGARVEFDRFMKGRRLYRTFGSWYGEKMRATHSECPNCGAIDSFYIPELDVPEVKRFLPFYIYRANKCLDDYG